MMAARFHIDGEPIRAHNTLNAVVDELARRRAERVDEWIRTTAPFQHCYWGCGLGVDMGIGALIFRHYRDALPIGWSCGTCFWKHAGEHRGGP